jgi:DNA invertase Pin-like site-specific DNA recombinase
MATIGYARVSTREQNPDGQTDALEAAAATRSSSSTPLAPWRSDPR